MGFPDQPQGQGQQQGQGQPVNPGDPWAQGQQQGGYGSQDQTQAPGGYPRWNPADHRAYRAQ